MTRDKLSQSRVCVCVQIHIKTLSEKLTSKKRKKKLEALAAVRSEVQSRAAPAKSELR